MQKLLDFRPSEVSWDWSGLKPVESGDILDRLSRCSDTKSGPDGIPYSSWLAAGPAGALILENLAHEMCSGFVPWGVNDSVTAFIKKKK
eukprot:11282898-Karenia_brevis.AAC.1